MTSVAVGALWRTAMKKRKYNAGWRRYINKSQKRVGRQNQKKNKWFKNDHDKANRYRRLKMRFKALDLVRKKSGKK